MIYKVINNGPKSKCNNHRCSRLHDQSQSWYRDEMFDDTDSICYSVVRYEKYAISMGYVDDYAISLCGMLKR